MDRLFVCIFFKSEFISVENTIAKMMDPIAQTDGSFPGGNLNIKGHVPVAENKQVQIRIRFQPGPRKDDLFLILVTFIRVNHYF